VKVAAPVNMISCTMQGGCECENAPLLRIETNNMEIGALMAPRPLLLCSVSGDWTKETPKVEYPAIASIFELYGAAARVTNVHLTGPHGYPKGHREAVYGFFRKWLMGAGDGSPFPEPPFQVEKKEDLLVWAGRELPKEAKKRDTLEAYVIAESRRQRDELLPKKPEDRKRFAELLSTLGLRQAIQQHLQQASLRGGLLSSGRMLTEVVKQCPQQRVHRQGTNVARQPCCQCWQHIQRAMTGLLPVQPSVLHLRRQPQAILRRHQIVPPLHLHLYHTTEGIHKLPPGMPMPGVGAIGWHPGHPEKDRTRQRVGKGRRVQMANG
jgi:hypothetical protein